MSSPSLRQLEYFCAVVELSHFGKAAERCFVTQSTLSVGIQELEGLLGAQLFERTKRKVMTTPLGLQLYDRARQILIDAAEFVDIARQSDKPLSGAVRLGCIPTISPFLLPKVLPRIRIQYPDLQLYLVEAQTSDCIDRLKSGDLDAAILALPYDIGGMLSQEIGFEDFYAAVPAQHPLAAEKAVHSKSLPVNELLLLEEGHCLRDHVLSACRLKSAGANAFEGTSLYTLLEMVAGGQGITLVPAMAMQSELTSNRSISYLPLLDKGPHRRISLVWRSTLPQGHAMKLLAEEMADSCMRAQ